MRSQTIRTRNLPENNGLEEKVHVKPITILSLMLVIGIVLAVLKPFLLFPGILITLMALFALFIMPDRVICEFRDEYVILYNERKKTRCNMIYYEDVVSWQYEWYPTVDKLVFNLVDGTSQILEVYSKASVRDYLDDHLPHKEVKKSRVKRAKA